jgi:hypothetical protein
MIRDDIVRAIVAEERRRNLARWQATIAAQLAHVDDRYVSRPRPRPRRPIRVRADTVVRHLVQRRPYWTLGLTRDEVAAIAATWRERDGL